MAGEYVGTVIEKDFLPPPGAPAKYWCYVLVQGESGERTKIRLHQKIVDNVTIGDQIRFSKPWRKNKRVRDVEILRRGEL